MKRILFICARNQWRSPTAARHFRNRPDCAVRSAGLSAKSPRQVSNADVDWADLILVMEPEHKARLRERFRSLPLPPIYSLDIPDLYQRDDPELIALLEESVPPYLP